MTETDYPGIQISTQDGTKNVTFRAHSGEELAELVTGFLKVADETIEGFTAIEQVILAKSVLSTPASATPRVSNPARSVAPPTGDTPTCKHGPMKNIGGPPGNRTLTKKGQPYQAQFYCPYDGSDWKSKCKPVDV